MEEFFGLIEMDDLAIILLVAVGLVVLLLLVLGWRNRVMMRLGLRNIPRRRAQTTLIVFGLMLSTLIVAAAFGTGDTMSHSFRSLALDDLGEVDEYISGGRTPAFTTAEFDFEEEGSGSWGRLEYFGINIFESLAEDIAREQDKGNPKAEVVEGLTPILEQVASPVINRTARQGERQIAIVGYDPVNADAFDTLHSTDGKRVRVAELGPGEAYLGESMAKQLDAEPGHELELHLRGTAPLQVKVRAVVRPGELPGNLIMPLDQLQAATRRSGRISGILVSNQGGPYEGEKYSVAVTGLLEDLLPGTSFEVQEVKRFYLLGAEIVGSIFTTMFIGFGSFSIAAALLLIFLIFVMLAAERKQEMGMARAVGTRRRHLIQMFIYEGTAYDLVAAGVGALLGAAVGLATVGILGRSLESFGSGLGSFRLRHHLEPRSVIVAYCLGVLLTFVTVAISSWRVSRLNIVSAIRDLPPPASPDAGLRALFAQPWRHLVDAFRQLFRLRPHRTLKRLLWDGPMSSLSFFWALIGRGPLTVLFGFLALQLGRSKRNLFAFDLGVSLILIGIGLIIRWTLRVRARRVRPETRDRIAFSFAGITLLIFWSLPFDALDSLGLSDYSAGPEMFVLVGVMMVAGAVWTIIYNSDLLLGLVTRLLSPFSSLLPVVRTAIAYPMNNKFRTGLTIAMFALVIFMLVFMSVFVTMINEAFEEDEEFADAREFDLEVSIVASNPIPNLRAAIEAAPELDIKEFAKIERKGTRQTNDGVRNELYGIALADGVDAPKVAEGLESAFVEHGVVTQVYAEEIEAGKSMMNTIFRLMQAFMGLGLVVGSASIGIASTRAVVERRQQIGVLRAIGYRPWMIQWSFLLEASFVALLGIIVGIGLGLILAYNFFNGAVQSEPGTEFSFSIPWATLGIVAAISYAVSMLTTYLPSWQAARIYPAEALRYE
jgi:putative ABC transport system permease protein